MFWYGSNLSTIDKSSKRNVFLRSFGSGMECNKRVEINLLNSQLTVIALEGMIVKIRYMPFDTEQKTAIGVRISFGILKLGTIK